MWNGIKPTHLWHKTGKKHMNNMLSSRFSARFGPHPPTDYVREREHTYKLYGIIMASAAFTAYMFGMFSKPNDCRNVMIDIEEEKCPSDPCPAIPPPPRPKKCPGQKAKE